MRLPVAVGFGISTPEQVCSVWQFADAAVVGSAIVHEIENLRDFPGLVKHVSGFARAVTGLREIELRLGEGQEKEGRERSDYSSIAPLIFRRCSRKL